MAYLFSSVVREAHHIGPSQVLLLKMASGTWYRYRRVPEAVWIGLLSAKSAGRYYNENVRGVFESERIPNNQRPEELR